MSVFTEIARGTRPGTVLWSDPRCFVVLSNEPVQPGHVMVVPTQEWPTWLDVPPGDLAHLVVTAQAFARALDQVFQPRRVVALVAGREIPHVHLHLIPITNDGVDRDLFAFPPGPPAASAVDGAELGRRLRALLPDGDPSC
jgi:diadenosine tetraphosphate (Ap4A) HIT family hydrolase